METLKYRLRENTKMERDTFAKDTLGRIFSESIQELEKKLLDQGKSSEDKFLQVFDDLFSQCCEMQRRGEKEAIAFLHIFSLKSSLFTGKYEIQINLFDAKSYFDTTRCEGYWLPEVFMKQFDDDMAVFYQAGRETMRPFEYEHYHEYRIYYYYLYLALIGYYTMGQVSRILGLPAYERMVKTQDFKIIFGSYMDRGIQIYPFAEVK